MLLRVDRACHVLRPPKAELPNNARARKRENEAFLNGEITDLLASGAVSKVSIRPWAVIPRQVVEREGKKKGS